MKTNQLTKIIILSLAWIGFLSFSAFAQTANNPFSRIGLGDISAQRSIANLGMGGVGVSTPTVRSVNLQNPALLRYNRLTVFEAAGLGEYKDLQTSSIQTNDFGGNLGYLSLVFPVHKKVSVNAGFQPFTTVRYTATTEELLPNTPTFVKYNYTGTGGVSQVFLSAGYNVFQNLSVGGQVNYNFGAVENTSQSILDDRRTGFVAQLTDRYNYGDFTYRLGLHYFFKVFDNAQVNLGLTYDAATNFNARHFRAFERKTFRDLVIDGDTLLADQEERIRIPQSLTFGVSLQRGYLEAASSTNNAAYSIGIDYTMQDWTVANESSIVQNPLQASYTINFGGEYIPNVRSTNFLSRTAYRAGFSYSQTPLVVNGISIEDISLSIGFSFPVKNNFSTLNLYGAIGQRGDIEALKEQYIRFGLGVSISDRWFVRSRFD